MRAPSGSISAWRVPTSRSRNRSGSRESSIAPPTDSVSAAGAGSSPLHTAAIMARNRSRAVMGTEPEAAPAAENAEPCARGNPTVGNERRRDQGERQRAQNNRLHA